MLGQPYFDLCLKQSKQAFTILNCWFARDVTVALLMVKSKSVSLLWELNSIFMQIPGEKKTIERFHARCQHLC